MDGHESGERRRALTDSDVERIALAVADKAAKAFRIGEEKHYNDHQRLDKLLTSYESAQSIFWKFFLGMMLLGMIALAGLGVIKESVK